mmetsp:Transcript_36694/g.96080  ORF Transcript_36694/g.96080 Transcript_36694/m.96080 type:complete len:435 (+) Transcript_36694:35-1339(+)
MMRLAVIAATIAGAAGQSYLWSGRQPVFNDESNWQSGASPLTPSNLPTQTQLGNSGAPLLAAVNDGTILDLGAGIVFNGDTRLILGSGAAGQGSRLSLPAVATSRSGPAVFNPVDSQPAGSNYANLNTQPAFDATCNLNWRAAGAIPANPPCTNTVLQVPLNNGSNVISTFGNSISLFRFIGVNGNGNPTIDNCGTAASTAQQLGRTNLVILPQCAASVRFGAQGQQTQNCPVGLSATCGPSVTFRAETNGSFTAATYTVVLRGPYGGRAYQVGPAVIVDVTDSAGVTVSGNTIILGNASIDATTGAITRNNLYPQPSTASSSSSSGAVIGVAVICLIVVVGVIATVWYKKRTAQSNAAAAKNTVAFDNPLYDSGSNTKPGFSEGAYDNNTLGEGDDNYLDVPMADESGGYDADFGAEEAGGYMDVGPDGDDGF